MSDILIRGMEMPKHCGECPFKFGYWFYDFYICAAQHGEKLHINVNTGFDDRCPLGNVPPHGDLIDRDVLRAEFPEPNEENGGWRNPDEALVHKTGVWAAIDAAPTIIPASE